jgi:MSHA biogenesis protein MshL
VVVVKATPNEQRQVEQYLRAIQLAIERQVMIEAKIIEVTLSRDAQAGVNWAAFGRVNGDRVGYTLGSVAPGTTLRTDGPLLSSGVATEVASSVVTTALGAGFYGLALQASNFAAMLNFLQSQGDVSVLSSPRIATLNNQKAVLKVGTDEMFVTGVSTTTTTSGVGAISTPTLSLQPFFSGIALDVTPQIDDAGNVILHMHPSISKVTEKNKLIDLGDLGEYRLPLASSSMSQTDNIVRVKDGQIVAIGGLMTHQSSNDRSGVPVLQDTPVVGGLFRQTSDTMTKRELVILMKPTVIRDDEPWPGAADAVPALPARP